MVEGLDVILACMAVFLPLVFHTSMSHMLYTYLHTQSSQYTYEIGIIIPALQVRKQIYRRETLGILLKIQQDMELVFEFRFAVIKVLFLPLL